MAEAAVVTPNTTKFFCHKCNVEISRVLPDFTCPNCLSGFIEELEIMTQDTTSDDSSDAEFDSWAPFQLIGHTLLEGLQHYTSDTGEELFPGQPRGRDGSRGGAGIRMGHSYPTRLNIRRSSMDRQMAPFGNLFQDFLVSLAGMGLDTLGTGGPGGTTPVTFYGNPGDYAWGRGGLDAIITHLLNQMDGTGPPPLTPEKIGQIPTVTIGQDQVDKNLQCSVCWEDFKLNESVRQLLCEHYFHNDCIVPWLELHGTCPICRKTLSEDNHSGAQHRQGRSGGPQNPGFVISQLLSTLDNRSHSNSIGSPGSSSSSSSGSSRSSTSSNSSSSNSSASSSEGSADNSRNRHMYDFSYD